jgi:very-short-patch-repair endonuclease
MDLDVICEEFLHYDGSLLSFCERFSYPYNLVYKRLKKSHPNSISRNKNGTFKLEKRPRKVLISPEEMKEMFFEKGMGQKEIAEELGVTKGAICYFMKKHNIDVKSVSLSRYFTKERRELHRQQALSGITGVFRAGRKFHSTSIEVKFMKVCDEMGINYKRQFSIEKNGHPYDFYIPSMNLLVEMDGVYWHTMENQVKKDKEQMAKAEELGYNLVRITDKQIKDNPLVIKEVLSSDF